MYTYMHRQVPELCGCLFDVVLCVTFEGAFLECIFGVQYVK